MQYVDTVRLRVIARAMDVAGGRDALGITVPVGVADIMGWQPEDLLAVWADPENDAVHLVRIRVPDLIQA